jgi:acetoin utilization deacetylase AcuC-like enzyme
MLAGVPYVTNEHVSAHDPGGEVYVGVRTPGTELPERAERIEAALVAERAQRVEAEAIPDGEALALHDAGMVGYLRSAWEDWQAAGLDADPGQDRVVPYLFPTAAMLGEARAADALEPAAAIAARGGHYAYDTMTLIGPDTWRGARAAIDTAIGAADLVAGSEPLAYALCRPPGHHATTRGFGGSCYLNNAAAAADRLRTRLGAPVAVIDIDAHHGNGTEEIFWSDGEVLTASVHVDPAAGWFPHYAGFAEATGAGAGAGANLNVPLTPGTGDRDWLDAVARVVDWAVGSGACAAVVALGVDAHGADPESPLEVTEDGYRRAGELLGASGMKLAVVQEGGYRLETIGPLVVAALSGMAAAVGSGTV